MIIVIGHTQYDPDPPPHPGYLIDAMLRKRASMTRVDNPMAHSMLAEAEARQHVPPRLTPHNALPGVHLRAHPRSSGPTPSGPTPWSASYPWVYLPPGAEFGIPVDYLGETATHQRGPRLTATGQRAFSTEPHPPGAHLQVIVACNEAILPANSVLAMAPTEINRLHDGAMPLRMYNIATMTDAVWAELALSDIAVHGYLRDLVEGGLAEYHRLPGRPRFPGEDRPVQKERPTRRGTWARKLWGKS